MHLLPYNNNNLYNVLLWVEARLTVFRGMSLNFKLLKSYFGKLLAISNSLRIDFLIFFNYPSLN